MTVDSRPAGHVDVEFKRGQRDGYPRFKVTGVDSSMAYTRIDPSENIAEQLEERVGFQLPESKIVCELFSAYDENRSIGKHNIRYYEKSEE